MKYNRAKNVCFKLWHEKIGALLLTKKNNVLVEKTILNFILINCIASLLHLESLTTIL